MTFNHFSRVFKGRNGSWEGEIGVLLAQGIDVSNFLKNVLRVSKSISKQGTTFNHFSMVPKGINRPWIIT